MSKQEINTAKHVLGYTFECPSCKALNTHSVSYFEYGKLETCTKCKVEYYVGMNPSDKNFMDGLINKSRR